MKHAATQQLYSYWASLCRGRTAPERNDIDPAAIRGVLADTFMIDVDPAHHYPIRISGTRMNALFCQELKGLSLLDLWDSRERAGVAALVRAVVEEARPVVTGAVGQAADRDALMLEMALFPLRHKGRTHARLLGCLSPRSIPTWLGLVPIQELELRTHRVIDPASAHAASNFSSMGFRGLAASKSPLPVRHGHFTVYEGGLCLDR